MHMLIIEAVVNIYCHLDSTCTSSIINYRRIKVQCLFVGQFLQTPKPPVILHTSLKQQLDV